MDNTIPRRLPGASGSKHAVPDSQPGAPSRALRIRAAGGWEKFMRRANTKPETET
ncbi:hypothetical protein ACFYN3_41915 [Streptomyces lavendulae]|uniref:hypothetical protein n=1 Tax=Streptomyces lavendulae TaxID=1914 RepID=UPI0033F74696